MVPDSAGHDVCCGRAGACAEGGKQSLEVGWIQAPLAIPADASGRASSKGRLRYNPRGQGDLEIPQQLQ